VRATADREAEPVVAAKTNSGIWRKQTGGEESDMSEHGRI